MMVHIEKGYILFLFRKCYLSYIIIIIGIFI
jgi:hypothetical protein